MKVYFRVRQGEEIVVMTKRTRKREDIVRSQKPKQERSRKRDGGSSSRQQESGGWFRRRDKSGSKEKDRLSSGSGEEKGWFRRYETARSISQTDDLTKKHSSESEIVIGVVKPDREPRTIDPQKSQSETHLSHSLKKSDGREKKSVKSYIRRSSDTIGRAIRKHSSSEIQGNRQGNVGDSDGPRTSSPEMEDSIITASLKITVPLSKQQQHTGSTFALNLDDIPYIEDIHGGDDESKKYIDRRHQSSPHISEKHDPKPVTTSPTTKVDSRQRSGSNDSYLGQPITGSMTFQPIQNTVPQLKQSHDSAFGTGESADFASSPSLRNTPSSDLLCVSGGSTPISAGSPHPWKSNSSTPTHSPTSKQQVYEYSVSPYSEPISPPITAEIPISMLPTVQCQESAKLKTILKPAKEKYKVDQKSNDSKIEPRMFRQNLRSVSRKTQVTSTSTQAKSESTPIPPQLGYSLTKSKDLRNIPTASSSKSNPQSPTKEDVAHMEHVKEANVIAKLGVVSELRKSTSASQVQVSKDSKQKSSERRRYNSSRHATQTLPDMSPPSEQSSATYKRWEIISSDPDSQETFV